MASDHHLKELVDRARTGDTEAFGILVKDFSVAVRSMCLLRAPDPDRADDLSQQVFLIAWKRLPELAPGSAWWPWLESVGRNLLRNEWRRVQRERGFKQRYTVAWLAERDVEAADPGDAEMQAAQMERLRDCMEQLPAKLRKLVKMRYEAGCSSEDIAGKMGGSASAVRQMLVRLRMRLRNCVERRLAKGDSA